MLNEVGDSLEADAATQPSVRSLDENAPAAVVAGGSPEYQAQLRLARLRRYLSRRDWEWLEAQNPAAARQRKQWCFRQFVQFCGELQQEQRRISKARSLAQCAPVGELIRIEAHVTAHIAELLWLGTLYFLGIRADAARIVQEYLGIDRLIHPALSSASLVPALG